MSIPRLISFSMAVALPWALCSLTLACLVGLPPEDHASLVKTAYLFVAGVSCAAFWNHPRSPVY